MRSLAAELEVTPMAVYRHVRDKDEVLEQVVSALFETVELPGGNLAWDERLRVVARAARDLAIAHPHVVGLLFHRPTSSPAMVGIVDTIYRAILEAGVPGTEVPRLERLTSSFVLGFAVSQAHGRFGSLDATRAHRGRERGGAHQELSPVLAEPVDWDQEYEQDLTDLIRLITDTAGRG